MRVAFRSALLLAALAVSAPAALHAQGDPDWHRAIPGFRIAGNLYYVGTADLAVYLVATPQGNILINSDFKEDVPTIRKSIEGLGFKYADTKIILISHAHGDHDEGVGLIKSQTGAQLMVMDADVAQVESTAPGRPGAKVDRVLHDRDLVELGGAKLTARLTPGHTPGCTTWLMPVADGGRTLDAVIIGSPNVNPGYVLVGDRRNYPQIASDYIKTFAVLKSLPVDLFLGAHGAYFDLKDKLPKMRAGGRNPFIDPAGYHAYVAEREQAFEKELAKQTAGAHVGPERLILGTWKLNVDKSNARVAPDYIEIRQYALRPDGYLVGLLMTGTPQAYHYLQFVAKSDGKDYPEYSDQIVSDLIAAGTPTPRTYAEEIVDAHVTHWIDKVDGRITGQGKKIVSEDGKTLTITTDGAPASRVRVYDRTTR